MNRKDGTEGGRLVVYTKDENTVTVFGLGCDSLSRAISLILS